VLTLASLALNQITGSSIYQGVAAVLIALVLIRVSLRLVLRNHDFLLGQPITPTDKERVRTLPRRRPRARVKASRSTRAWGAVTLRRSARADHLGHMAGGELGQAQPAQAKDSVEAHEPPVGLLGAFRDRPGQDGALPPRQVAAYEAVTG